MIIAYFAIFLLYLFLLFVCFFQSVRSSVEHGVILTYRNTGTTFKTAVQFFVE